MLSSLESHDSGNELLYSFSLSLWGKPWKDQQHLCASQEQKFQWKNWACTANKCQVKQPCMVPLSARFNQEGGPFISLKGHRVPQNQLQASICRCTKRSQVAAPAAPETGAPSLSSQPGGDFLHWKIFTNLPSCWKQCCSISWFAVE